MTSTDIFKTNRKTAIIVGIIYIIGTVSGILSLTLTDPIRNAENLLIAVAANENQTIMGALFVLIMGLALAMIPVSMFPILRKQQEALALGYIVFRGALEAATDMAMAVSWLLLLPLSRVYEQTGTSDASVYQAIGTLLFEAEELATVLTVVFCLGAFMFYTLLYQSRLVPRWLSIWGLVALLPYLASGLLATFALVSTYSTIQVWMQIPLALQEMVLAIWLIVKGFNPSAIANLATK